MNNRNKVLKIAQKISVFLLLAGIAFGNSTLVANAALVVNTTNATNITYGSAVVNGVLHEGSLAITAWFEFGTNPNSLNLSTSPQTYNSLSSRLSANLGGLNSNTTYYFRAVAQNSQGRVYGNVLSFTTSYYNPNYEDNNIPPGNIGTVPNVLTQASSNITPSAVTLNGVVNGGNLATTAWFEWGNNINFTNSTTQNYYGPATKNFSITVANLNPNTTYYFRAVAQNSQGRVFGSILSFTTLPAPYAPYPGSPLYIDYTTYAPSYTAPKIVYVTRPATTTYVAPATPQTVIPMQNINTMVPVNPSYVQPQINTGATQTASAIGSGFLPGSLTSWLLLIVFALVIMLLAQYLFFPPMVLAEKQISVH